MAAALLKHESLPADIAAEGLRAADLSPLRFMEMPVLNRRGNE
jgi:hypothetical protein